MGASGNMVMAALYELLTDKDEFHAKMERLDFPNVKLHYNEVIKCGIKGTHISVVVDDVEEKSLDVHCQELPDSDKHKNDDSHDHNHTHDDQTHNHMHHHSHNHRHDNLHSSHPHSHHHHLNEHTNPHTHRGRRYGYKDILALIDRLDIPDNVKNSAVDVYRIIGEAEAKAHGVSLEEIHFHEVGSIDAVVDVVGCSLLVDMLRIVSITTSPVHVGFGMIRCEHGILPVPAPATAEILSGIPMYSGQIEGELCTPTGAALLKYFSDSFGAMPPMLVEKIGYGMGTKDFEAANCLRAFLYEDAGNKAEKPSPCFFVHGTDNQSPCFFVHGTDNQSPCSKPSPHCDTVYEISCNLDDMTPEAIGAAFEVLLESGALDVYTTPIMMKKNRPAVMLSCLCTEESRDDLARLMLIHTTTLGVRMIKHQRVVLNRTPETVQTKYGDIRVKKAQGFSITKQKPEYDDVQKAARKHNVPYQTVYEEVMKGK